MIVSRDSVKVNGELRLVDGFVIIGHLLLHACIFGRRMVVERSDFKSARNEPPYPSLLG
jgi:hypothetical protein